MAYFMNQDTICDRFYESNCKMTFFFFINEYSFKDPIHL